MVSHVQYFREGGSGPQKFRSFIPGSGQVSPVIWCRDMGSNPVYWKSPGEIPTQGGYKSGGNTTSPMYGWDLDLPPTRIFLAGIGLGGDGDLHLHTP